MAYKGGDVIAKATGGVFRSLTIASGDEPNQPTISVSVSGTTATITINGDAGATNNLLYKAENDSDWTDGGNRSGDGNITAANLAYDVYYIFTVYSENADGLNSLPAAAVTVIIKESPDGVFATAAKSLVDEQLDVFGDDITYDKVAGGTLSIVAIAGPEIKEVLENELGTSNVRSRTFSISTDESIGYSAPGEGDTITYDGIKYKVTGEINRVDFMANLHTVNQNDLAKHNEQMKKRWEPK